MLKDLSKTTPGEIYSSGTPLETPECAWNTGTKPLAEWLEGQEVTFLRQWYDTLNPDLLGPDIHWHNADGSPYGGIFIGAEAIKDGYFRPVHRDFDNWRVTVEEVNGSGNEGIIIVRGHFHGRARTTGIEVTVPFANFWGVRGGEIVSMQQYTDTRILADALSGIVPLRQIKTEPLPGK